MMWKRAASDQPQIGHGSSYSIKEYAITGAQAGGLRAPLTKYYFWTNRKPPSIRANCSIFTRTEFTRMRCGFVNRNLKRSVKTSEI